MKNDEVIIRRLEIDDAEAIYPLLSDPVNSQYITFIPHDSIRQTKDFIEWHINNGYYYAITLAGKAIGFVGADKLTDEPETGKIGYVIDRNYWGKGYAPFAIRIFTEFILSNTDITQIIATIKPENIRSQRCIEKAGYVFVERLEHYKSSAEADTSSVRLLYKFK